MIFARTRYEYPSYSDLWRLVELSGYPVVYVDQIDPDSDATYIYTPANGETLNGWAQARARIILWQMEWLTEDHQPAPGVSEVWYMDAAQAMQYEGRYVPIGSHPDLAGAGAQEPRYDFALMAYMEPHRRRAIADQLQERGLTFAPNGWDAARDTALRQSRAMLHIHQHNHAQGVAGLRVALAAAYGLPYISEEVPDKGIFGYSYMLFSSYRYLADFAAMWIRETRLQDYGLALHTLLCREKTFRRIVEGAV